VTALTPITYITAAGRANDQHLHAGGRGAGYHRGLITRLPASFLYNLARLFTFIASVANGKQSAVGCATVASFAA